MSEAADLLVIGRISSPYGLKGWVNIHSYTEPVENLLGYNNCRMNCRGGWRAFRIEEGRQHGRGLVARLQDVEDRNAAEGLKGCEIAVAGAELPRLREQEFYWHQLEGLSVRCGRELLGRVDYLLATGANDVLVVKPSEGSRDDRERLVPWIRGRVVTRVDLVQGELEVDWDPEF